LNVFFIEADDGSAYIEFLLDSKSCLQSPNTLHRCDTFEQASLLVRDVQRAQDIFQEEKLIYITSNDETEDNYNDILDDQQTE